MTTDVKLAQQQLAEQKYRRERTKSRISWIIAWFLAIFWMLVALIPFAFMIFNSFRKQFDMFTQGVFHLPGALDLPG